MVPMVHLLESQERDRLLDGDANGRGFCMWDCGLVKLKSSECVCLCARCTAEGAKAVRTTEYN